MKTAGLRLEPEGYSENPFVHDLDRRNRFSLAFVRDPLHWWGSEWNVGEITSTGTWSITHTTNGWNWDSTYS
jgi:hypothetical protein